METSIQKHFSAKDLLKLLPETFTSLTKQKQELSLAIYKGLEKNKPVTVNDLVSITSLNEEAIQRILNEWPGIFYDDNKAIIGYWGLAIKEMAHKIELDNKTLYGWCAWDTLFIPQLIGKDATIRSIDHSTKEEVVIKIDKNGDIASSDVDEIYLSMLTVDEESIQEDVVTTFCHFIHFFNSKAVGEAWTSEHEGTFLISLKEAIELSQTKNKLQYHDYIS